MWIIVGECHNNIYNIVTRSTVIQIMVFKQFLQKNLIEFYVCSIPITKTNTSYKIEEQKQSLGLILYGFYTVAQIYEA